jgi:replicative DNA helicase
MGEISEAPLFIDDTPNMTLMEIRAKARRLRQRHELKVLVVDYLQLMTSPRRVESRQQEVSELSRGLKLLAKEIDCPVIAVAQLNRGPEQRTDKRPQLADLRECLTGDTLVTRADTGARVPISDLVGLPDVPVWGVDQRLRMRAALMSEVWSTGVKPVYRVGLASGGEVTATGNHPLLTADGWRPVRALAPGDQLAMADAVPDQQLRDIADSDLRWSHVVSVEPAGEAEVFDAHVPGIHTFLANGIVSHNSGAIEQDSDVVILLHRDDYYDKESPRAGEADFIVAKHRNGPTDTVTVAAQLHFSRFVDMAIG